MSDQETTLTVPGRSALSTERFRGAGDEPGLAVAAFALCGAAAWARTAPTEKPTRLRAGMVIWLPPRMDFTWRAATLRKFQVPKPIGRLCQS